MIRSYQVDFMPMHPKEFVALYGRRFAVRISGYPWDTLSKYLSNPESKRYIDPKESVKLHFGAIHQIILFNSKPQVSL
jgi:hypothetical protein